MLALKSSLDLNSMTWQTTPGYNLALAAQTYGLYITDNSTGGPSGHTVSIAIEDEAARFDMGLSIDPITRIQTYNPTLFNASGFNADVSQILQNVYAVTGNH